MVATYLSLALSYLPMSCYLPCNIVPPTKTIKSLRFRNRIKYLVSLVVFKVLTTEHKQKLGELFVGPCPTPTPTPVLVGSGLRMLLVTKGVSWLIVM